MNIKHIIDSIGEWAKRFIGKILPTSKDFLEVASTIVNGVKAIDTNHPEILNAVVALIPGDGDNYLLAKLRELLPSIVVKMKLAIDEAGKTPDEIFSDAVKVIQSMEKDYKSTTLAALWAHIANSLTDNGVSLKDLLKLQQTWYEAVAKGDPTCIPPKIYNPLTKSCVDPLVK